MKRKGIYRIFIILLCLGCLLGCGTKEQEADEKKTDKKDGEIILHAGAGAWEMEYIFEGAGIIPGERSLPEEQNQLGEEKLSGEQSLPGEQMQSVRYIYDSLSPEEYLKQEPVSGPEVLIANSRLGYKISLGTGERYRMRSGDRLFLRRSSDVEIYTDGLEVERKSFDGGRDICEIYRKYGNWLFQMLEQGRELLFYQCSRQRGKLYITYF